MPLETIKKEMENQILEILCLEDCYPLSPLQQGMLFNTLRTPASGLDIEQMRVRLPENLNIAAFQQAWERVVQRHAILRTAFCWEGVPEAVQEVYPEVKLPFTVQDWSNLPAQEIEHRLATFLETDRQTGFAMNAAPLMRLALFRLGECEYQLVWTFHHALLDGRCFPILLQEVFAFYQAFCTGQKLELPPPVAYRQHIDWLIAQFDQNKAETFWRQFLKGFTAPTPLVSGTPPSQEKQHIGLRFPQQQIRLEQALTSQLQTLAQENQVTLNNLVQAAWAMLLSRYSGETDIVFGATRAGRRTSVPQADSMVGLFINTLPMRTQIDPDTNLLDLLKQLRQTWVLLRDYEHTPLFKIQAWSELPPATGLFESLMVFENYILETNLQSLGENGQHRQFNLLEKTNYPLTLQAFAGSELILCLHYDPQRFDDETITRMLAHMKTLLQGMTEGLHRPLKYLSPITETERQQILIDCNNTVAEYPVDLCLHQLFEAQVEQTGEAVAVIFAGADGRCELSYRQLNQKANQLADYLQFLGVGPEVRVGICTERSPETIIGVLAILKAGAAYVPLDPTYPPDRLAYMLERSQAPVVLTQQRILDRLPQQQAQVICLDTEWQTIAGGKEDNPKSAITPENLAYIIFTSGSTGLPKGVAIDHRGAVNTVYDINQRFNVKPGDRGFGISSLSFDLSVYDIFGLLACGATLVIPKFSSTPDPADWLQDITREQVTLWNSAPALMQALIDYTSNSRQTLPKSLRLVMMSGDWIPLSLPDKIKAFVPGIEVISLGGATEASIWSILYPIETTQRFWKSIPYGKPMKNQRFYVLDEALETCAIWMPGHLYIGGDGLARCYWLDEDKTRASFITHPRTGERLYRTGDLGRYLSDGNIEFLGRTDFQVKIRGYRIELGEIETAIEQVSWVQNCAVAALKDASGTRCLVGYVVPNAEMLQTVAAQNLSSQLRDFLQQKLPAYMIPGVFVIIDKMPLTPNGKVDRKGLPEPDFDDFESEGVFLAPRDDLEMQLVHIWQKVLGVKYVGIRDNFFDLGGHSLLAVRLFAEIEKVVGKEIPLATVFQAQTVEEMANIIRSQGCLPVSSAPVLLNSGGPKPPLFCIYGILLYYDLARCFDGERPVYGVYSQVEVDFLKAGGLNSDIPTITIPDLAMIYLEEIRQIQPTGPYYLAGESFGGLVIFEMANQLLQAGEPVNLVALFDTASPGYEKKLSWQRRVSIHWQQFLEQGLSYALRAGKKRIASTRKKLANGLKNIYNPLDKKELFLPEYHKNVLVEDPRQAFRDWATKHYIASPYPGKVTLFRATNRSSFEAHYCDPKLWEDLALGGLKTYEIPGDHIGILKNPNVQILAENLNQCLQENNLVDCQ